MTQMPGSLSSGKYFAPNYSWLCDAAAAKPITVEISHAAVDATLPATYPTGLLRSGLVMGKITVGGKYKQYDDAAVDGSQVAVGVLLHPVNPTLDHTGNAIASGTVVLGAIIVTGLVDSTLLIGDDANGRADLALQGMLYKDAF